MFVWLSVTIWIFSNILVRIVAMAHTIETMKRLEDKE